MKESADIRYTRIYDRIFEMCYPDAVHRSVVEKGGSGPQI